MLQRRIPPRRKSKTAEFQPGPLRSLPCLKWGPDNAGTDDVIRREGSGLPEWRDRLSVIESRIARDDAKGINSGTDFCPGGCPGAFPARMISHLQFLRVCLFFTLPERRVCGCSLEAEKKQLNQEPNL
jgi:hypothetical protein